jgi:hypothetical protein
MEIVKSIRLSPKNSKFPSVEVLHFKKSKKEKNGLNNHPIQNKSESKSSISLPSAGTQNTETNEMSQSLVPKKLSFNSCISIETPEKRLEALHNQMNSFLYKLKSNKPANNRYIINSCSTSKEDSNMKSKEGSEIKNYAAENAQNIKVFPESKSMTSVQNSCLSVASSDRSRELIQNRIHFLKKKLNKF